MRRADPYVARAEVVRIVDGDTLEVTLDLGWKLYHRVKVRLLESAPELGSAEGDAAKVALEQKFPAGTLVDVISKRLDKYGRTLGELRPRD